jgi:hypothetical protein
MGEISMVAGMKFPWILPADSSVTFSILICSEENLNKLTNLMRRFSETIITETYKENVERNDIYISYNYNSGDIILKNINYSKIESLIIFDILGKLQYKQEFVNITNSNEIEIKTENLPSGTYFIAINGINLQKVIPILIYK